jgi:glycosyltransferase involved in cell wall biosynthesis
MRTSSPDQVGAPASRARALGVLLCAPVHMVGGQALAAQQIATGFGDDAEVRPLVQAVDPRLPGPLRWLTTVKGIRSVIRPLLYALGVARAARRVDVVHVFAAAHAAFFFTALPALFVGRLFRKPVILNYRDGRAESHLRRSPRVLRWAIARASALVVPSAFLQRVFARYGFEALVIPNVVDTTAFRFRDPVPLRPRLISARLLEPLYGIENILRAFAIVRARVPDAECDVYGTGESEPGLRRLADALGTTGICFRGRVSHAEMPAMLAGGGILVNSSRIDNQPHTLIEAFAAGIPVVTTAAGGIPDILEHERTGLLVPMDQPEALAEAVLRLLREPHLVRRLTTAAHAECRRYTWTTSGPEWAALYGRLTGRRRPGWQA